MVVRVTSQTPPELRPSLYHEVDRRGDGRGPSCLHLHFPHPKSAKVTRGGESKEYLWISSEKYIFNLLQSRNQTSSGFDKTHYSQVCEQLPPCCSVQRPIPHFRQPRARHKYEITKRKRRRAKACSKARQEIQSRCYV